MNPYAAVLTLLVLAGCAATAQPPSPDAPADPAPTGKLRTAHNIGNAALASRAASGELRGITVELAQALAREAGLVLEPIAYESVAAVFQGLARGEVDVLFLADDPARASQVDFVTTYMEVRVTYAVPD